MGELEAVEARNGMLISREICIGDGESSVMFEIATQRDEVELDAQVQQLGADLASLLRRHVSIIVVETICYEFEFIGSA